MRSDRAESEEVDEADDDADRDGGIAGPTPFLPNLLTLKCAQHHVMFMKYCSHVALFGLFDHWSDEPVWARESKASSTFQRADAFPNSKNALVEAEPLL